MKQLKAVAVYIMAMTVVGLINCFVLKDPDLFSPVVVGILIVGSLGAVLDKPSTTADNG